MTTPFPLGRRVQHDPRSVAFALPVLPRRAIKSVDWTRRVPVFDQGSLGSCTGNAAAGWLATDNAKRKGKSVVTMVVGTDIVSREPSFPSGKYNLTSSYPVDEDLAVKIYSLGTKLDEFTGEYPPDDTGSSGLGVSKALKSLGLCSSYSHAFSLDALKAALQTGPVMWGTVWYNSMFDPDSSAYLVVNVDSGVAGGHELCVTGYDVDHDDFSVANSWGTGWGNNGFCYVKSADMAYLLGQGGDITQPVDPAPAKPITGQAFYNKIKAIAKAGGLT